MNEFGWTNGFRLFFCPWDDPHGKVMEADIDIWFLIMYTMMKEVELERVTMVMRRTRSNHMHCIRVYLIMKKIYL